MLHYNHADIGGDTLLYICFGCVMEVYTAVLVSHTGGIPSQVKSSHSNIKD